MGSVMRPVVLTMLLLAVVGALALGVNVAQADPGVPLIRVAVRLDADYVRLSATGPWKIGRHRSGLRATAVGAGETWVLRTEREGIAVLDGFGNQRATVSDTLFAYPEDPLRDRIQVDGKAYRGQVLLWKREGRLQIVNVVDLESYLKGVVPIEIGGQTPKRLEAIKAQAVAARSYTLSHMGRWRERGFDVMGTIEDQAYGGADSEIERCTEAVDQTRGVVGLFDRAPIQAYYSSTCGGHTANPTEVWMRDARPYLQGVRDRTGRVKDSFCAISPRYQWEEEWVGADFEAMLDETLPRTHPDWDRAKYGRLRDIEIDRRTASKRVADLVLKFEKGKIVLHGDAIRWTIRRPDRSGLQSCLLEKVGVARSRDRVTRVKFLGRGFGHGVGMCQYGAIGMAEAGYSYPRIIHFYYRDTEIRRVY